MITQKTVPGLDPGYESEVDAVAESEWCKVLQPFDDANIYQTWSYDEVRAGRENISHLTLRRNGEIVAAAQARIMTLPIIGAGIAYVRWGPLWRRDGEGDPETFRQAMRALRLEYACRRGLVLRVYPAIFRDEDLVLTSILREEGFSQLTAEVPDRTLLLNLSPSIADLRQGLRQHWRRYLKVAEKNDLEIVQGQDEKLFDAFIKMYREMVDRKAFLEPNDINEFRMMQRRLPEEFKMIVMLCLSDGVPCAGIVCSAVGKTAVYLFGATSNAGLTKRGSYLLHWKLIERLKNNGCRTYDLHGINPVKNPGTYKFKSDLCGSNGRDVSFAGRFDTCASPLSSWCITGGDKLRAMYRSLRTRKSHDN